MRRKFCRFTDRSRFPKDAEIGAGAAFIEVDAMDSLEFVCPTYGTRDATDKYEQLIIHQVSDLSFMSCELDSRSQVFLVCDSPLAATPITYKIVFRQISSPNGFEYQPGRSYYLITTSNGSSEGMNNTRLGLCVDANMRLRIDVRYLSDQAYTSDEQEVSPRSTVEISEAFRINKEDTSRRSTGVSLLIDDDRDDEDGDGLEAKLEKVTNKLNNESQKFAEKHGFDLTRLEYVRQLAIEGVEGDFSFRELENFSSKSLTFTTKASLTSGPGRPRIPYFDREEAYHSTSRQAQRWISNENQNKFGTIRESFFDENKNDLDSIRDYVVDDVSGHGIRFSDGNIVYVIVTAPFLLWFLGR